MALWTKQDDNAMKIIKSKSELKNAKFGGRKPDKLLVPSEDLRHFKTSELKKYISHTGLILAIGMTQPIYDGRLKGK